MSQLHSLQSCHIFSFVLLFVFLISCEKKDSSIIDSLGTAPLLSNPAISPSIINTDTINIGSLRQPDDVLTLAVNTSVKVVWRGGSGGNKKAQFVLRNEQGSVILAAGELLDDGINPDLASGDSVYSAKVSFQIVRSTVGRIILELFAEEFSDYRSNSLLLPLQIVRANQPPVLSDLQAPDTLRLANQEQVLQLRITAVDADGQVDVRSVIFNSFRPDGNPSLGNPFRMFDDGEINGMSGDVTPNDGIYSLKVSLPSNTNPGTYRFEFQAFDRSNAGSTIIIHRITVLP